MENSSKKESKDLASGQDAYRRSHRSNIGVPPQRYGFPAQKRFNTVPLFTSTPKSSSGALSRVTMSVPEDARVTPKPSRTDLQNSLREMEQKLEQDRENSRQLEIKMANMRLQIEQGEHRSHDAESDDEGDGYQDYDGGDEDEEDDQVKEDADHPAAPANEKAKKSRSKLKDKSSGQAGAMPHHDDGGFRYHGDDSARYQTPRNDNNSLAEAIVQALQFQGQTTEKLLRQQTQNTEKFLARQNQGSALPTFSGNPLEWPMFHHHYMQSTQDCGFTPAQNMARLEKALRGEARRTVRALMIVPTNSDAVMETLEQRFGRPDYVIQALMEIARKTPSPKENKLASIVDYSIAVSNLVLTIKAMNESSFLENPTLLQELVDKLPENLKLIWGVKILEANQRPNLDNFAWWVGQLSKAAGMVTVPKLNFKERKEEGTFLAADPESEDEPRKTETTRVAKCEYCDKDGHYYGNCKEFKTLATSQRWEWVKNENRCFRCLRKNHSIGNCRSKLKCGVRGCSRSHNQFLHEDSSNPSAPEKKKEESNGHVEHVEVLNNLTEVWSGTSLLKIAVVELRGPKGSVVVNALMDDGSTATLLSSDVAKKLGLSGPVDPLRIRWTNATCQEDLSSQKVGLWISQHGSNEMFKIKNVRTVESLNLPKQRTDLRDIVARYEHLRLKQMKYLPGERPMILLGEPHAHLTVARSVIEKDFNSPLLTETKLGWVMHGPLGGPETEEVTCFCHHETTDEKLHELVKESFALESIGIQSMGNLRSKEDAAAETKMEKLTRRVGDRWETGLLWKEDDPALPPSKDVAMRRLKSTERKINRDKVIQKQYHQKILHYVANGYAHKLSPVELKKPSKVEWYLPHFYTTHPNKPGKIRIVLDAKSPSHGVSLNDHLLTGPDLLRSLPGILIKFRQKSIAISGDIAEMFHQILIREEDRPAQRFLWREKPEDEPSVYQLDVLMFGSVCSPYCAQYVKNRNALEMEDEFPAAAHAIVRKHYMDDYLDSMDTEEEAIKLAKEVAEVHKKGGFVIGKWTSNSPAVRMKLAKEEAQSNGKNLAEWAEVPTERALGLHWISSEDMFTFRVNLDRAGIGIATGEIIPTKRAVLRMVMLIWDPLGFLGNYTIKAKILLQDVWKARLGWDDQLTDLQFKRWRKWIKVLSDLRDLRIPRCYSYAGSSSESVTLHIFADSSEVASSAVAYLRVKEEDTVKVTIILAKTRVAPLKPCSIPKLELTAALMASRLGKFILDELEMKIHEVTYWTDSMTVLRWIHSEARRYQQFVANRIGEIHENTKVEQWKWVPSGDNPADDATRDGKADVTNTSRWFNGPSFLYGEEPEYPCQPELQKQNHCEDDYLRKEFVAVIVEPQEICVPDVNNFSNYNKIVRCMARILSINQAKGAPLNLVRAANFLWKSTQWEHYSDEMQRLTNGKQLLQSSSLYQLSPMLNEEGVLKMRSRLERMDDLGLRSPVILPPRARLTQLLIQFYHRLFHHGGQDIIINELRQRYFIPRIRSTVRKVVRACVQCKKRKMKPSPPAMGALPEFRLQQPPRAFFNCGMDYFGPMDVTIGRRHEKRYGVLFTCLNTRAVHLELAHSLTTDSCIMAIRRFVSARGQPRQMHSDNGTNLRGAEKELRKALEEIDQHAMEAEAATRGMTWNFIPPAAPHMGGSWERLVRSVKTALAVILKERAPREEVLITALAEAAATVNSHPLTEVPVDPETMEALTPFHFLIGTSSTAQPPGVVADTEWNLSKQWRKSQALANMFWKRWLREYLPTLQRRTKWHKQQPKIEVGDVVVVMDESLRRNTWPLGIILKTFPGKDGVVRVADVKTATGVYRRPVVKLGKLDVKKEDPVED